MNLAPYPSLLIEFSIGEYRDTVHGIVDTGFDGDLVVPATLIGRLPEPDASRSVRLASGQSVRIASFQGAVSLAAIPGMWRAEILALGDEHLLGIRLLNHCRVTFDHGQRVIVEP